MREETTCVPGWLGKQPIAADNTEAAVAVDIEAVHTQAAVAVDIEAAHTQAAAAVDIEAVHKACLAAVVDIGAAHKPLHTETVHKACLAAVDILRTLRIDPVCREEQI